MSLRPRVPEGKSRPRQRRHWIPFACPIQQLAHTSLKSLPFAANILAKVLLVVLHAPCQIQFQAGFPNPIPVHLENISKYLVGYLSLLPTLVYFLFIFQFSSGSPCSSQDLLPALHGFPLKGMDQSQTWRRWSLKINWLFWSSSSLYGSIPRYSSKQFFEQSKVCSSEVQGCDPIICLFLFSWDAELYHSWSPQPSLPCTFTCQPVLPCL